MRKKNNAGFTLIELVVTLVCCSIVTLAVMTVLLTGTRIGRAAEESSGEQQTVRIVLTALESMISDGTVSGIQATGDDWQLLGAKPEEGESAPVLLSYSGAQGALLTSGGTPLLEGLTGATAKLNENGDLLTVSVELDGEAYTTSVYCRVGARKIGETLDSASDINNKVNDSLPDNSSEATYPARKAFLLKLASQYGSSGQIIGGASGSTYSLWYCGGSYWSGWDANTPWCALFLSWAASEVSENITGGIPKFSNVNDGAEKFGWKATEKVGDFGTWKEKESDPTPGDFIFFDWERDGDPDHVGVVLSVDTNGIYTIEGNSGGKVAVRYYPAGDARIIGYGVLNWKTTA